MVAGDHRGHPNPPPSHSVGGETEAREGKGLGKFRSEQGPELPVCREGSPARAEEPFVMDTPPPQSLWAGLQLPFLCGGLLPPLCLEQWLEDRAHDGGCVH